MKNAVKQYFGFTLDVGWHGILTMPEEYFEEAEQAYLEHVELKELHRTRKTQNFFMG